MSARVIPHYTAGQWADGPDWAGRLCPDGGDWDEWVDHGYHTIAELGSSYVLQVFLHQRKTDDPELPPYFITVTDGDWYECVSAGTLPDAMDLLARWAPAVTAAVVSDAWNTITAADRETDRDLLTNIAATIRANEADGRTDSRMNDILDRRAEEHRQRQARRQARQAANGGVS